MAEYRRGAHTVYEIHLHLVWTTKYRKLTLVGEAATRVCATQSGRSVAGTMGCSTGNVTDEIIARTSPTSRTTGTMISK